MYEKTEIANRKWESLPIYRVASDESRNMIRTWGHVRTIGKHEYLFRMRDAVGTIYLVMDGYAVLERSSDDHGVKAIFLLRAGEIVNEVVLNQATASVSCYALTELTVVGIPRNVFLELMERDFMITKLVIDSMALKIRKLYRQVESSTKPTRMGHQVASRIWKFARDFGKIRENGEIEIPFEIRITLLAEFVGSNRETVSRIVKEMTEQDILSIKNGVCIIYDADRLQNFSKK